MANANPNCITRFLALTGTLARVTRQGAYDERVLERARGGEPQRTAELLSLPVASRRFAAHPTSSRAARTFVANCARSWGCEHLVDDAALLVSELVTNAVLHARAPVDIRVRKGRDDLRIEVYDEGAGVPLPIFTDIDASAGRGLGLVQAIAACWGVDDAASGKTVWFELPLAY